MTVGERGPLYARVQYHSNGHDHTQLFDLNYVGTIMPTIGQDVTLVNKGGDEILASVVLNAYADATKGMFHVGDGFDSYDILWASEVGNPPIWIFGGALDTAVGVSNSPAVVAGQSTLNMRCNDGSLLRIVLMEATVAVDQTWGAAILATEETLSPCPLYLVSDASAIVSKRGGFPVVPLRLTTKTNDVLRRKYKI